MYKVLTNNYPFKDIAKEYIRIEKLDEYDKEYHILQYIASDLENIFNENNFEIKDLDLFKYVRTSRVRKLDAFFKEENELKKQQLKRDILQRCPFINEVMLNDVLNLKVRDENGNFVTTVVGYNWDNNLILGYKEFEFKRFLDKPECRKLILSVKKEVEFNQIWNTLNNINFLNIENEKVIDFFTTFLINDVLFSIKKERVKIIHDWFDEFIARKKKNKEIVDLEYKWKEVLDDFKSVLLSREDKRTLDNLDKKVKILDKLNKFKDDKKEVKNNSFVLSFGDEYE